MSGIAIVDTETVGLDARLHGIWEVAVILHEPPIFGGKAPADEEYVWQLPVDLSLADPNALRISRFYERRWIDPPPMPQGFDSWYDDAVAGYPAVSALDPAIEHHVVPFDQMHAWATRFATLTAGRVLVGANPSFDEKRLGRLLRELGVGPAWHYRPVCVEALAVGYLRGLRAVYNRNNDAYLRSMQGTSGRNPPPSGIPVPWSSTTVAANLDVGRARTASHTALGDCRWARDLWIRIMEDE